MPSLVIVGAQWGDEGKGKVIDALAAQADFVVRFQGGDNAGHTVHVGERKYVFHILPSGMLRPGVMNVIGGGVVVNLERLAAELAEIGLSESEWSARLRISAEATLILPCHLALDRHAETRAGKDAIGTTQRGIGPVYVDRTGRWGVRLGDTLDDAHFGRRVRASLEAKRGWLPEAEYRVSCDPDRTIAQTLALARPFRRVIADTGLILDEARRAGKRILFEGAQGTMLDVSAGTYPFVTSSHTIAGGAAVGAGIGPRALDRVWGVLKAYTTRVGEGPFPTELKDATGERLRELGGEYGATTRRPRRCGWLDLVQMRRAVRVNGLDGLVVTKLDVLDGFDRIGVAVAYRCGGRRLDEWPVNPAEVAALEPELEWMPGWKADTGAARRVEDLPAPARRYLEMIESRLGVPVVMATAGKDRENLIMRQDPFPVR
jgi:adenylosuccinate synthase